MYRLWVHVSLYQNLCIDKEHNFKKKKIIMTFVSDSLRKNIDFMEDLANYLTIQLVQHGGKPLPPDQSLSTEELKKALETIDDALSPAKNDRPFSLKVVPDK